MFPRDIFEQEVEPFPENWADNLKNLIVHRPITLDTILPLFEEICRANHPVLLMGYGVRRCSSPQAVVDFAHAVELPVVTTVSGRSEFPNNDSLYLGMIGVMGHPSAHTYLKKQADLVIVVGANLNITTRQPLGSTFANKKIVVVSVLSGGEVYILKQIIHDWDHTAAIAILKNCRVQMAKSGKILLIETVVPPRNEASFSKLIDLEMLVISGGYERNEAEYRALFKTAGFELTNIITTHSSLNAIEGIPV